MSWLCAVPLLSGLIGSCPAPGQLAAGYVEGQFVLTAPVEAAEVREILVRRGDAVRKGDPLARLEATDAVIAVAQAKAALLQAQAQLADLKLGKRPEELAVLDAALRSARAQQAEAARVVERTRDLNAKGISTKADLDAALTARETADAAVGQAEANLAVGRLPARAETIAAAEQQVKQAGAALEQAEWRLSRRTLTAPADARVTDVIRNPGELSGPSAPVLSLLPRGAVKVKLYVPEATFSRIAVGQKIELRCDGCPAGLEAEVSYASPEPEFTPPVIYSLESRQKLSHLVEAIPLGDAASLKPGQIVDVAVAMGARP